VTALASSGGRVEPVVAPPPGNPRFPLFDGLRAVAAIAVLVFHAAFFAGALGTTWWGEIAGRLEIGVAVFFAISGFLLYRPYFAAHYHDGESPRPRDFLRRRVLRIVPAYWLALTLLAVYPGLSGVFGPDWWVYYGFGQVYSEETFSQGIPQAWTLCVEVTFYLALPVYALALRAAGRGLDRAGRLRLELAVLLLLSVACLALRAAVIGSGPSVLPYTLAGLFDWFAAGMALAVLSVGLAEREAPPRWARAVRRWPGSCWLLALVVFLLLAWVVPAPSTAVPYGELELHAINVLSPVVAVLLILPAVVGDRAGGSVRRLLALPVVTWLGLVSYGLYLWQADLLRWVASRDVDAMASLLVLGGTLTVAAAAASYYVAERPILSFKDRRRRRTGD
jgi:peptidoglycan/LPS O-acetylase OafA/YrhL